MTRILPAGTTLYHGTASPAEFDRPRAPAWFALDRETAEKWAGWSSEDTGPRRVLTCRTTAAVALADTVDRADWETFCEQVCGDPEPTTWTAAHAAREKGIPGWYGRREVLLTDTDTLEPAGITPVPSHVVSFGGRNACLN